VFNAAAEKMFRCSAKDAIGNSLDRFIPQWFRAVHKPQGSEFGRTGITSRSTGALPSLRALRTNGEEFSIEASISEVDVSGKKLVTFIIRDITERKQAEEAQIQHSAIVESSSDAIISMNLEGMLLSWNAAAERIYGYTKEEAIGKSFTIIIPSDLRLEATEILRRLIAGESLDDFETVRVAKNGKKIDVSITEFPVRDSEGNVVSICKIAQDITARNQAEAANRESEERFRLVANTAPVMIWMSGPDKLCTYFNQPWLEFTGRALNSELGNGWTEGVHPEDLNRFLENYTKRFDQRESYQMEYRLRRHDGAYRWILAHGVPRFNADGSFGGYIGSCIDVTDRKLAEEALSTLSRRLIDAHEEERIWLARELHDDINQRVALLAASLTHLKQALGPSAVEASHRIEELCNQTMSLGIDVQTLSHRLHSSKLDYLGLRAAAAGFCREFSDQHGVEIDFRSDEIPKNLPKEVSLCLFRVLQEALQNAMKHSGSRHFQVTFATSRDDIRLMVADPGHGFDPVEAVKGQGIGLINMNERMKLVRGEFSITSKLEGGTVVHARVPLGAEIKSARAAHD